MPVKTSLCRRITAEASLVAGIQVYGFAALKDVAEFLEDKKPYQADEKNTESPARDDLEGADFATSTGMV